MRKASHVQFFGCWQLLHSLKNLRVCVHLEQCGQSCLSRAEKWHKQHSVLHTSFHPFLECECFFSMQSAPVFVDRHNIYLIKMFGAMTSRDINFALLKWPRAIKKIMLIESYSKGRGCF